MFTVIAKESGKSLLIPDIIKEVNKPTMVINLTENSLDIFHFTCDACTFKLEDAIKAKFYELEYYEHFIFYTYWDLNDEDTRRAQYAIYNNLIGKTAHFLVKKSRGE